MKSFLRIRDRSENLFGEERDKKLQRIARPDALKIVVLPF